MSETTVAYAEQAVLSALLLEPERMHATSRALGDDAFADAANKTLFGALRRMATAGTSIDPMTIRAELERSKTMEAIGGMDYVAYLIDVVPSAANVEYHAKIVRRAARIRALRHTCEAALDALGDDGADVMDIARTLQGAALPFAVDDQESGFHVVTKDEVVALGETILARAEALRTGTYPGLATGFVDIDDITMGFRPGELIIFAAVPKAWKSALVDNILINCMQRGAIVGKVSAEMTRQESIERMIGTLSQIPAASIARGRLTNEEWTRFGKAAAVLNERLHIDDQAFPELGDVVARCFDLKARVPDIAAIAVDYLQLVMAKLQGRRGDEEITEVSKALKGVGKRLGIPVFAPAACNFKEIESRTDKRPTTRDIQGSSGPVQVANFYAQLFNPTLYDPFAPKVLEIDFAACRRTAPFKASLRMIPEYHGLRSAA